MEEYVHYTVARKCQPLPNSIRNTTTSQQHHNNTTTTIAQRQYNSLKLLCRCSVVVMRIGFGGGWHLWTTV